MQRKGRRSPIPAEASGPAKVVKRPGRSRNQRVRVVAAAVAAIGGRPRGPVHVVGLALIVVALVGHAVPLSSMSSRHVTASVETDDEALPAFISGRASMFVLVMANVDLPGSRSTENRRKVADRTGDAQLEERPEGGSHCTRVGVQRVGRRLVVR